MFTHRLDTLTNGLPVLSIPMPAIKSVTVLVLANTGSRYESADKQGIAHFFEHIVFKGTEKFPTAQELSSYIDAVGADFNAFTSKEYTGYYVKAASQHTGLALDVISDMLLRPQIRQSDIDREKGVIIEEINMYADTPARHVGDLFDNLYFKGTGLEHDIIGSKETVSGISSEDFKAFLKQWYGYGNLLLVMAGDDTVVGQLDTFDLIETYFAKTGPMTEGRVIGKQNIAEIIASEATTAGDLPVDQRIHLAEKKTEQAHFVLGWPGIHRMDPRRYAVSLLSTILGGPMSSRLFIEVREQRGLCYYIHADTDLYHDRGVLGVAAGVDPTRITEALKVTLDEFYAVTDGRKPITAAELQRAKDYVAGKMVLGLEDSESVAQFFGMRQLLTNQISSPDEVLEKIRAVTLDEVNQVARELIVPDQVRLTIIGPYSTAEEFAQLLR